MAIRKKIAAGAAVCVLFGNMMNVSAAEPYSNDCARALIENQQESLVIDVEAYKAAYDDLAKAFGNDKYAYVNHYLTIGVFEGRMKGVLFDPIMYTESYGDVKDAYGYDISSIVEHYIKFGMKENRTQGTAQGYSDIAAAEKAGVLGSDVRREGSGSMQTPGADTAGSVQTNDGSRTVYADTEKGSPVNDTPTAAIGLNSDNGVNVVDTVKGNGNAAQVDNSAAVSQNNAPVSNNNGYHHTTSIYDNDESTLLRVEYYDDNNQLIKYSSVTGFDSNTNSYMENIYHYDEATNSSVLERTDIYENGVLSSTQIP